MIGGFLGGAIGMVGYWILTPQTESVILFVLVRVIVGFVVATILAPIAEARRAQHKI